MAIAYEVNNDRCLDGVSYRVIGTQIHEHLDTESFVDTNTNLTPSVRRSISRSQDEVWEDAIDSVQLYYQQQRAAYYGLDFLSKVRGVVEFVTAPHSIEISLPMPGLVGLRRRLSTGS